MSALACDVTATFTTAGVTCAANVSIAWSSESSAPMLLSSSGVAVGAAIGPLANAGFANSWVASDIASAITMTGAIMRRVRFFVIQFFILFLLLIVLVLSIAN